MAENAPIRTIHAGVGRRGRWPLEVLTADPRFASAALVDVSPDLLSEAQALTGLTDSTSFTQLEQALAAVAAEAVIICTPTEFHGPLARLAFQAGKHVLVEKGMTTNWQDAVALVAEAESAGVKFCVSQNYRYRPEVQTLHAALASGDYGTPHLIDLVHHRYRPTPRTLDYYFAMVWDMSVHHLDNLVFCFGAGCRGDRPQFHHALVAVSPRRGHIRRAALCQRGRCHVRHVSRRQFQRLSLCSAERRGSAGLGRRGLAVARSAAGRLWQGTATPARAPCAGARSERARRHRRLLPVHRGRRRA